MMGFDHRIGAAGVLLVLAGTAVGQQFQQETATRFPAALNEYTNQATLVDLEGDGDIDIAWANGGNFGSPGSPQILRLYVNDGDGFFADESVARTGGLAGLIRDVQFGDVDGDGDLDLWIGQYKFLYFEGSMPTPFYDANDGYPAALLVNDGKGNFLDNTDAAGLSKKRNRRTFSSSLVDLDDDGDLDLMTVNDFCGVDAYLNDGGGKFADATDAMLDQRHLFGMGHCFADFNHDGLLDFYG
jgi:hypothetical protein